MKEPWSYKIETGMKLIIEGCKENPYWCNCKNCPFDVFCTSIDKDEEHNFSTPDSYEEEGLDFTEKEE